MTRQREKKEKAAPKGSSIEERVRFRVLAPFLSLKEFGRTSADYIEDEGDPSRKKTNDISSPGYGICVAL